MKIDVNKSGRIFDFLVTSGMLILAYDPTATKSLVPGKEGHMMGLAMDGIIHRPETHEIYMNGFGHGRTMNGGLGI